MRNLHRVRRGRPAAWLGLAVLIVCGRAIAAEPPRESLGQGRAIFEARGCSHCHAIWGAGGGAGKGPDLGRTATWADMSEFAGTLWNHAAIDSASRPPITAADMESVAAYLSFVRFVGAPGDPQRGATVFRDRLCARCHQIGGRGGTVGPRLDELKDVASGFFMVQALWNHGQQMAAKMAELDIERPRLQASDVADLVAFIRGNAASTAPLELIYVQSGSPRTGEQLFHQKGCINCHAIAGSGGTIAPDLGRERPGQLTEMAAALWNHAPAMWAKMKDSGVTLPGLNDRDIADLLSYLNLVQLLSTEGGDATRGAAVFRDKACGSCHADGTATHGTASDVAHSAALQSPVTWAAAMWNHPPVPSGAARITNGEMRNLLAYLRTRTTN